MSELQGQMDMSTLLPTAEAQESAEGYDADGNLMDYVGGREETTSSDPPSAAHLPLKGKAFGEREGSQLPAAVYQGIEAAEADRLRYLAAGIRSDFDGARERVLHMGMLLLEARGRCPQGRWLEWLKQEARLPERTAQQAMQLYETFGAKALPENITVSHLVELLRAPEQDREALMDKAAEGELSTRELKAEVKRLQEAHQQAQVSIHDLHVELEEADRAKARLKRDVADAEAERDRRIQQAEDAVKRAKRSDEKRRELEGALAHANVEIDDLKNRPVETVEVEKLPDDVAGELERLRAELAQARSGEVTPVREIEIKLRIQWVQLTQGFEGLLRLVKELDGRDPEKGGHYAAAVAKLCDAMKGKVQGA